MNHNPKLIEYQKPYTINHIITNIVVFFLLCNELTIKGMH